MIEEFVDSKEIPKIGIQKIFNEFPDVDEAKPRINKFPRLRFNLSSDEVLALKRDGFFTCKFIEVPSTEFIILGMPISTLKRLVLVKPPASFILD
jgi:hypothetical protein